MSDRAYAGTSALVTGGQGFIGGWLVERLLDLGAQVTVPRRKPSDQSRFRHGRLDERCQGVNLDLLDLASVIRVLNEHHFDCVFHLAAQTIVEVADRTPLDTLQANVRATYTLLEASRIVGAPTRVVIASSSYVYGPPSDAPYVEVSSLRASRPYDVSKACTDMIARSYAATYGIPVAVVRLTNVYGSGDLNFSRLIPASARALVRRERPVISSDGTAERDYVYVEDAVAAYMRVADSLSTQEFLGRAWNAGGHELVPTLSLVRRLIAVSGLDLDPKVLGLPRQDGQVDRRHVDSRAIADELGWTPAWSLDEGLGATYAWYEQNLA